MLAILVFTYSASIWQPLHLQEVTPEKICCSRFLVSVGWWYLTGFGIVTKQTLRGGITSTGLICDHSVTNSEFISACVVICCFWKIMLCHILIIKLSSHYSSGTNVALSIECLSWPHWRERSELLVMGSGE